MTGWDDGVFAQVAARFGVVGRPRPLPGERTRNALVEPLDGAAPPIVVKVHPVSDGPDLDLELAALRHLRAAGLSCRVPAPGPSTGGVDVVEVAAPDGVRLARALTWVPGRGWTGAEPATALAELGRLVATVDAALAGFDHPHAGRPLAWNLARADELLAKLDELDDALAGERGAVTSAVLERFRDAVRPALDALPAQVIHNDANDANVLLDFNAKNPGRAAKAVYMLYYRSPLAVATFAKTGIV